MRGRNCCSSGPGIEGGFLFWDACGDGFNFGVGGGDRFQKRRELLVELGGLQLFVFVGEAHRCFIVAAGEPKLAWAGRNACPTCG